MQILETMSEVKITVTCKWYKTPGHPEMHPQVTVTRKMVWGTAPYPDALTHQIWNSYLKEYK